MPVKYHIRLSTEEQQSLQQVVRAKKIARYKRTHAQILLALDENGPALSESETAATCVVSIKTVQRIRQRCVDMARLFRTLFYTALASFCSYTNGAR